MSLQFWSLISDIVATTAVVISLLFLAVQIRLYTKQARLDSMDVVTSRRSDFVMQLATDRELAKIVWSGFAGTPRLPPHEWARFGLYLYVVMLEYERMYTKYRQGSLDQAVLEAWEHGFTWWLKHPGVRSWWKSDHPGFTPAFSAYMDAALEKVVADPRDAAAVAASFREQESRQP
jgi:hypothetical protein